MSHIIHKGICYCHIIFIPFVFFLGSVFSFRIPVIFSNHFFALALFFSSIHWKSKQKIVAIFFCFLSLSVFSRWTKLKYQSSSLVILAEFHPLLQRQQQQKREHKHQTELVYATSSQPISNAANKLFVPIIKFNEIFAVLLKVQITFVHKSRKREK